jgi:tetratricopeptide (TPR) repeat protein
MKLNESDFLKLAAAWATATDLSRMKPSASHEKTLNSAGEFLDLLRQGGNVPPASPLDDSIVEVIHAACALLGDRELGASQPALANANALYDFIATSTWPEPDFDERAELLCSCAFAGWRISRRLGEAGEEVGWLEKFRAAAAMPSPLRFQMEHVLATPIAERPEHVAELHLDDPEMLLSILGELRKMWDTSPVKVLEEATFLYNLLEGVEVRYPVDPILYDEREYFLGETARIAGAACRYLSRRDEARRWFDLSEAWFLAAENAAANIARLGYQRLALRVEDRDFEGVLLLVPHLIANFERLAMPDDALKGRFLQATVFKEMDRLPESIGAFQKIIERARVLRNETLLVSACANLAQIYGFLGDAENAMAYANEVMPVLQQLKNHVVMAKIQWGIGHLLRAKGNVAGSIEAFRTSQRAFAEIGMHADVAAVHLILADELLDAGQTAQAEWEIRAALPIIEEYKLVPEGIAAYALLRDSLRRRQIDRDALRKLHGYFRDQ